MRPLGLLTLSFIALLTACDPTLRGQCNTNTDCPSGTMCIEGLCLAGTPDGSTNSDGGTDLCAPACGADEQCVNGMCLSSAPAQVVIVSPMPGGTFGAEVLSVTVKASAPEGITGIQVRLNTMQGPVLSAEVTPGNMPDTYDASLNLADPAVTDGSYDLVAVMMHGGMRSVSTAVPLKVDRTGPNVRILPITYPMRPSTSPSVNAFLRTDTVEVDAEIYDDHAGLSAQPPVLTAVGMPPVNGTPVSGKLFKFTFDGRAPTFNAVQGDVQFQVTATNTLGTSTSATGSFRMSRIKWTWIKQRNQEIGAAPVLTHGLVLVGSADGYVYGLHPNDGSEAWEQSVGGTPVGHLTAGSNTVYAALGNGHVVGLNPVDTPLGGSQRLVFQCQGGGGFGQPPARPLTTGLALATTPNTGSDPTAEETLFAFTQDGYVHAFRQAPFPSKVGPPQGCMQESMSLGTQNDASTVTALQDRSGVHLFFGDLNGQVHALTMALSNGGVVAQPTFQFTDEWHQNLGLPIHGSLAYGALASGNGLVAVREDSVVDALDLAGMFLWQPPPAALPASEHASPIIGTTAVYVQDMQGNLQATSPGTGVAQGQAAVLKSPASANANTAPIAAADGRVYFAAGTRLASVAADGTVEWIFEPTQPGTSSTTYLDVVSPTLSCDGTLYVVATNQNRGLVHALITDSQTGLASSPWPRAFHDSHNTANPATPISTGGTCTD